MYQIFYFFKKECQTQLLVFKILLFIGVYFEFQFLQALESRPLARTLHQ